MIRHLAKTFALACAVLPFAVTAQPSAADAARAAEVVTAQANSAFERVDPDTEQPRIRDEAAANYAGLPPLTTEAAPRIVPADIISEDLPMVREPAVRMVAVEVVQPLPAPAPATTTAALASNDPFVIKSILPIESSIRYGDWFWDETAAPATGKLVITVDLEARVISAFRDGHEIGTAVALLGTQAHPTPLGTFPVLNKSRQHFSRKYNNAPMPHSLWITNTGIAIHGSTVMNGYASHGCIGVPDEFAAKLFAATKRGDKVIITRGKMVGIGDKVL